MNKKETGQLLYFVKANYPRHFQRMTEQDFLNMIEVWYMCLMDYDYKLAQAGLKVFMVSDKEGWPPSVGQVVDCIHKITTEKEDAMTELDAWGCVYKAICNSNYNSETEFAALPEIVRQAVGNPARLREWAILPTDEVQTVIQSNFMRSFRATQNRAKELRMIPSDVRQMIESTASRIAAEEDTDQD